MWYSTYLITLCFLFKIVFRETFPKFWYIAWPLWNCFTENIIPEIKTWVQSNRNAAFHLGAHYLTSTKIPFSYHRKQFETSVLGARIGACKLSDQIRHFWGVSGLEDFRKTRKVYFFLWKTVKITGKPPLPILSIPIEPLRLILKVLERYDIFEQTYLVCLCSVA